MASLTTTSFVVVTQWCCGDDISGLDPYSGLYSCGLYPLSLEAACMNCPILSWQKLCKWLSEIAALWITIIFCELKGKPKLGGTQELDMYWIAFLVVVIGVTVTRVEREISLMEKMASEALCDIAQSTFLH